MSFCFFYGYSNNRASLACQQDHCIEQLVCINIMNIFAVQISWRSGNLRRKLWCPQFLRKTNQFFFQISFFENQFPDLQQNQTSFCDLQLDLFKTLTRKKAKREFYKKNDFYKPWQRITFFCIWSQSKFFFEPQERKFVVKK